MRKLFTILMMTVLSLSVLAQTEATKTIRGAVIDKNGNPLPGATVNAKGGAETTMTDADGTFEMEVPIWLNKVTASYGGFGSKTLKTNFDGDMVFKLHKLAPTPGGYFLNIVGGGVFGSNYHGDCTDYVGGYAGIKGGHLANWGWYGEIGYDFLSKRPNAIIGGIRRIYGPAFFYLGIGYGGVTDGDSEKHYYEPDNSYGAYYYTSFARHYNGMAFDGGFIFLIGKHVDISLGLTFTSDFYISSYWGKNFIPKLSVGYVF